MMPLDDRAVPPSVPASLPSGPTPQPQNPVSRPITVVTGGSSGIGAAIAEQLALDGFDVLLQYSGNAAGAAQSAQAVSQAGGRALVLQLDFERLASAQDFWEPISQALAGAEWAGPIQALVLNAGTDLRGALNSTS